MNDPNEISHYQYWILLGNLLTQIDMQLVSDKKLLLKLGSYLVVMISKQNMLVIVCCFSTKVKILEDSGVIALNQ